MRNESGEGMIFFSAWVGDGGLLVGGAPVQVGGPLCMLTLPRRFCSGIRDGIRLLYLFKQLPLSTQRTLIGQ